MSKFKVVITFMIAFLIFFSMEAVLPVHAEEVDTYQGEASNDNIESESENWFSVEDFETLITQKVIPIVVFAITAIGGVYVAIAPVLNRMRTASGNMEKSSGGITNAANASRQAVEKMESFRAEIEKTMEEMQGIIQKTLAENQENFNAIKELAEKKLDDCRSYIDDIKENVGRVETMLTVGFGNSDELVRKGYAKVIFDIQGGTVDVIHGMIDAKSPESADQENLQKESGENQSKEGE